MTTKEKLAALIKMRDAATGKEKTALRWAIELAEADITRRGWNRAIGKFIENQEA